MLHPTVKLEATQATLDRRVTLAEIEQARLKSADLEDFDFPIPRVDPKKSAKIRDSEPMELIPARNGTPDWRRPGSRFQPKGTNAVKTWSHR